MRVGIAITKRVVFRNSTQEFSNVYYYDGLANKPTEAEGNTMLANQKAREVPLHSTDVTFIRGRLWSQVGDKSQNEMISQQNLSGTGTITDNATLDRERAWLFRLRAGVDSRGNPVYLRKWFHACGSIGSASLSGSILSNKGGFTQGERDSAVGVMNSIGSAPAGAGTGTLTSKNGRTSTAGSLWQAHAFLEHHQLGDQWRAS